MLPSAVVPMTWYVQSHRIVPTWRIWSWRAELCMCWPIGLRKGPTCWWWRGCADVAKSNDFKIAGIPENNEADETVPGSNLEKYTRAGLTSSLNLSTGHYARKMKRQPWILKSIPKNPLQPRASERKIRLAIRLVAWEGQQGWKRFIIIVQ